MEAIGLTALFQDANFQAGIKRYDDSVAHAESVTDHASGILSKLGAVAGGALVVGFGAAAAGAGLLFGAAKVGIDYLSSWNDEVNTLSDNLGTTGAQSSAWAVAFNHVGLSVDEGGAGLNFFVKQLDDLKNVNTGATLTTSKNADAIAGLNQRLEDANVRLQRAQKTLAEAKAPTDGMRYAVEDAQKAVSRLNAELSDATRIVPGATAKLTPFQQALKDLGIRAFDSKGKLRTFDEIMPDLLDSFQKLPAGVNKSALAMDLFGARAGTKFLDFLSQGSDGLEKARQLAELYGLTLDTDFSNSVEDLGFAFNDLNLASKGMWVTIGRAVLPVVTKFVGVLNGKLIPPLMSIAKKVAPLVAGALDKAFFIFDDFIGLLTGENKLPQLALNIGSLFDAFGMSHQVTDFILGLGKFTKDAIPNAQSLWNVLQLLITGDFKGGIFGLSEDAPFIDFLLTARDTVTGLWDALSKGDWQKAWDVVGSGAGHLGELAAGALDSAWTTFIQPTLATWGSKFWGWVTDPNGAVSFLDGKLGEAETGIKNWLKDHGPETWDTLVGWGTGFWTWLTGPDGAILKAGAQVQTFATRVGTALGDEWNNTVKPALSVWGQGFWDWLTDKDTGAISTLPGKLLELSQQAKQVTERGDVKTSVHGIGESLGEKVIDGISGFFKGAGGSQKSGIAILDLVTTFIQADANNKAAISNIGEQFVGGIFSGIIKEIDASKPLIFQGLNDWADEIFKWLDSFGLRIAQFWNNQTWGPKFPNTPTSAPSPVGSTSGTLGAAALGVGGGAGTTVPANNAFRGATANAQMQLALTPLTLQVMIGNEEIKNATLAYSYTAVTDTFAQATNQVHQNLK